MFRTVWTSNLLLWNRHHHSPRLQLFHGSGFQHLLPWWGWMMDDDDDGWGFWSDFSEIWHRCGGPFISPNKNPPIFSFQKMTRSAKLSSWEGETPLDVKQWKKWVPSFVGCFLRPARSVDVEWLLLLSIVNEAFLFVHLHQVRLGGFRRSCWMNICTNITVAYTCWDLY